MDIGNIITEILPRDDTNREFKPLRRNSLLGFVRIRMPSGVVFHDVSVHFSNGRFWAAPAAKPQMSREGVHLRDAHTAKFLYFPMVTFVTKEIRDKFSDAVIAALRLVHPDAFVIEPEEVDADALV